MPATDCLSGVARSVKDYSEGASVVAELEEAELFAGGLVDVGDASAGPVVCADVSPGVGCKAVDLYPDC